MSEIVALRTQIWDNLEILGYPDLKSHRFVLTWAGFDNDGLWAVFLEHSDPSQRAYVLPAYQGQGDTPEEAYTDMLKQVAHRLYFVYSSK
ncbi:hypothetical protein KCU92_g5291, partial [Aureobasidium melanogenum]